MRTKGLTSARIDIGVWDDKQRFKTLGSYQHAGGAKKWKRATIRFHAPRNGRTFGIFVGCPDEVGGQLWLDDARLISAK